MTSCQSCGKLIASGTGETLCRACRTEAREAAETAAAPPPAAGPMPEIEVSAAEEVDPRACVRCRKRHAMEDSDFCVGCQLELISALGDAAEEIFRTPPPPPLPPVASPTSLMNDLEEKRERTATSRIRVVGAAKIK